MTMSYASSVSCQTKIDISGTIFPKFTDHDGKPFQDFWYIKKEFINNSRFLLDSNRYFSFISAKKVGTKWINEGTPISTSDIVLYACKLRLFYMKSEPMSIYSLCSYMEEHIDNTCVKSFFKHMKESWEKDLARNTHLHDDDYSGPIKTNKQLIDTFLYSGNFHSQEKYKSRFDELLNHMDVSLILMATYNAFHCGYQMAQISHAIEKLQPNNPVIMLPNHLRHTWDDNCPYNVIQ